MSSSLGWAIMLSFIREIIIRRDLLGELVSKELKMRYSRLSLGFFWAILSPFLVVIACYIAFSVILQIRLEEAPFILYLMSAIFPWNFFQNSLLSAVTSLVDNRALLKEAGFPQYLIPVSIVLTNAVILLPSLIIIIILSLFLLQGLPVFIVFLPAVLLLHLLLTIALSIIASILYVKWRDIKFILEAGLLFLFYLTPVFYSLNLAAESLPPVFFRAYSLNPFVGVLYIYRSVLLRGFWEATAKSVDLAALIAVPLLAAVMFLAIAEHLYKKNKGSINDYLSY